MPREGRHTSPSGAHKPRGTEELGSQKKNPQAPRRRGRAQGAEASAPQPRDADGELRGLREARTSLHDAEGRAGEPRKDPRKTELARFGLQCRVGLRNRSSSNDSRDR